MLMRTLPDLSRESLSGAIARGDLKALRKAIAEGFDCNERSGYGLTPLMEAAQLGRRAIVHLLLLNGADVNTCDEEGVTALMLAASRCRPEIVRQLLDRGADAAMRTWARKTAMDVAVAAGDWASMSLLLKARAVRGRPTCGSPRPKFRKMPLLR
jgi:ankyrin repeat protein